MSNNILTLFLIIVVVVGKPATDLEKAICECCKGIDGTEECNDKAIDVLNTAKKSFNTCGFKVLYFISGSGTYSKQKEQIDVPEFSKWCRYILENGGYYIDMFALSWTGVDWSNELKQIMYESVYDKENRKHYDIVTLHRLIECTSVKFWNDFYEKMAKEKKYIINCLRFLEECYVLYMSYLYNQNFLGCSGEIVKLYVDSIKLGLPESVNIVQRLSPTGVGRYSTYGLIALFCSKIGHLNAIQNNIYWSNSQLKPFLYITANFYWPIRMIFYVLKKFPPATISVDIPVNNPYGHSDLKMSLESFLNLINFLCISVEVSNGEIIDYEFLWDEEYECESDVFAIKKIINVAYDLSNDVLEELVAYNHFDLLSNKKFGSTEQDMGTPKNPQYILKILNYLKNESGFIYKIKMSQNDDHSIGIRSFFNFVVIYKTCCITNKQMNAITQKLNLITKERTFIPSFEKEENLIKKEDYCENDDPTSLYNIRKTFNYQPAFDTIRDDEDMKSWGKVVFVATHVTSIRYNAGLINDNEVANALIKCLDDLVSFRIYYGKFCDLFPTNPFFGEFDNIIREKYSSYVPITTIPP